MIALAVVGPIASGKSVVLRMLRDLGAVTGCADDIARELTQVGHPLLQRVLAELGPRYRLSDGGLDRQELARLVFRSAEARERLEAILHPAILERIRDWLADLRARPGSPPVAAVEVLRLPRSLHAREVFDVVWLCRAPESTRRARLMARDGLEVGEAQRRLNVQATQNIDDCSPDLILDTGGSLGELTDRVRAGWGMLEGLTGAQQ